MPSEVNRLAQVSDRSASLTVVAHGIKIQALQVGQQECVAAGVPGAIADDETAARVAATPGIREPIGVCRHVARWVVDVSSGERCALRFVGGWER